MANEKQYSKQVDPKDAPADEEVVEGVENQPVKADIRLIQTDKDKDGKTVYRIVGGMWAQKSKKGEDYFNVRIGNLKLLAYYNKK